MELPWSHQKLLQKERVPSQTELLHKIKLVKNNRDKALLAICYLTGGRISEIVIEKWLRKVRWKKQEINGSKRRVKGEDGKYILEAIDKVPHDYKGIMRNDISYGFLNNRRIMLIDMQNRKHKKRRRKTLPILIDREQEFVQIVEDYMRPIPPDTSLFPICKSRAYQIIRKHLDINCHFMRHIRATHLIIVHGLKEHQLRMFMGWTDGRPAASYVEMRWQDIWK